MTKKNKMLILFVVIILILVLLIAVFWNGENGIYHKIQMSLKKEEETNISTNECILRDNDDKTVNLIFSREKGIHKIQYPDGFEIECNNRQKISIDFPVEENKEYVFTVIDNEGNTTQETFTTPSANVQLTKRDFNISLDNIVLALRQELNNNNISTNFIKMTIGESKTQSTTTTNVATIFKNWKSFGDGNWGYSSANNWIYNTKNSNYMTGYYDPNGNYENIELEFEARTTDSDDDMIGSMIRFNSLGNNKYSSYLFLLDSHDMNSGIGNGAYNGINKVVNSNFTTQNNLTKLSCNPNNRWTRNKWQKYKFVANGSTITAYIDGKLVSSTTDPSISSGTIGFVCYSQAYTYFRNITMTTTRLRAIGELIKSVDWNSQEHNIIINIDNETDSDLSKQDIINTINENEIYYFAIGSNNNKQEIEDLLTNINNRGLFTESANIDSAIKSISEYLLPLLTIKE